jgi:hypothetical protein
MGPRKGDKEEILPLCRPQLFAGWFDFGVAREGGALAS